MKSPNGTGTSAKSASHQALAARTFLDTRCGAVLGVVLLLVAVTAAFFGSLDNGSTNWDDDALVLENPLIRDLSPANWVALCRTYIEDAHAQGPITSLSLALDFRIGGLRPAVFHRTALILHLLNCLLLFFVVRRLGLPPFGAWAGVLLVGLHPLRVESVAWIAERKDLVCAFFFFGAMLAYQRYTRLLAQNADSTSGIRGAMIGSYLLCFAAFLLALGSKPMAVTLPAVLLLIDARAWRRFSWRVIYEKVPFFLGSCLMIFATWQAQSAARADEGATSLALNLLVAIRGLTHHLWKTILPIRLSAFYPYPEDPAHWDVALVASSIGVLVLGLLLVRFGRHSRPVLFGATFFLVTLLPVLKIFPVGNAMAADRYTYIPAAGLVVLIGLAAERGFAITSRWAFTFKSAARWRAAAGGLAQMAVPAAVILLALLLGLTTSKRCEVWRDSLTLWRDVIAKHPEVPLAHYNLGLALRLNGDLEGALRCYTRTIELDPRHARAHNNLAFVLRLEERFAAAESHALRALSLEPRLWEAHLNLAYISGAQGRYGEALAAAHHVLDINAASPDAHYVAGLSYCHLGRNAEAEPHLATAVALDPELAPDVRAVKARFAIE